MMLGKNSSFIGSVPEFNERYLVSMHFEDARIMVDRFGELRPEDLFEIAAGTEASFGVTSAQNNRFPNDPGLVGTLDGAA
jgi:hypothetical protein